MLQLETETAVDAGTTGWLPEHLRIPQGSPAMLHALYEGNTDMVLLVRGDGRIDGANGRALAEFGYPRCDLEGQPVELLLPAAARERHAGHLQKYMRHPSLRAMGSSMNRKARDSRGNEFPVDVMLWPFEAGSESYVLVVCHRLEDALARAHLQIHALVDNHRDHAVNLIDPEGRILTWNEGASRFYKLQASEALGKHYSILFTPEQIAAGEPESHLEQATRHTESARTTGWRTRTDGAAIWVETYLQCTRDPAGQVLGFTLVRRDFTTFKRAEEALREANRALSESEERFRLLVESVTDYAIYMLDPEGRIVTWNVGAERSKGYKAQEVLGRSFSIFFPPEAVQAGLPAEELATAARNGRYETEGWRLRKDGKKIWVLVALTAIHGADGTLRGFAAVVRDMTVPKMLEEAQAHLASDLEERVVERTAQLEATVGELRRKNEEIEAYADVVAHDLKEKEVLLREVYHRVKNNLQVVQSLLKMRARSLPSGEAQAAIETSVQRVHVMAMVHERLYAMPDLAGISLTAYLNDVAAGAIASHAERPDQVEFHLDAVEIPLTLDLAIPLGLLANELISNCLKHGLPNGRKGKIRVIIAKIPGAVRIVFEDDGIGLPGNFDLAKSTSMGLKLASSLARQLGGQLEFTSGNGCRVQADLTRLGATGPGSAAGPNSRTARSATKRGPRPPRADAEVPANGSKSLERPDAAEPLPDPALA